MTTSALQPLTFSDSERRNLFVELRNESLAMLRQARRFPADRAEAVLNRHQRFHRHSTRTTPFIEELV